MDGLNNKELEVWKLANLLPIEVRFNEDKSSFHIEKCARSLSQREKFDSSQLTIDFKNHKAILWTAMDSYHGSPHYDDKTEDVDWDKALESVRLYLRPLAISKLKRDAERQRQLEEQAQDERNLDKYLGINHQIHNPDPTSY